MTLLADFIDHNMFLDKWLIYTKDTPIVVFASNHQLSKLHFEIIINFIDKTISSSGGTVVFSKIVTDSNFRQAVEHLIKKHTNHADMNTFSVALKFFRQSVLDAIIETGIKGSVNVVHNASKVFDAMDIIASEMYHMDGVNKLKGMIQQLNSSGQKPLYGGLLALTQTERKICELIAEGLSTKEISDKLNIAEATVQTHRKKIRKKLNITNKQSLYIHLKN